MGKKALDIVMEQRGEIVEKIIANMEEGYFLVPSKWNKQALRPQNPISKVKYVGVNRLILGFRAIEKGYTDPRWLTYKQAKDNNLKIKPEELKNYAVCEKWLWTKEVEVEDEENPGKMKKEIVDLKVPQVLYFRVYNGNQVINMPELKQENIEETEISKIADNFILSSECPVEELAEEKAFYSPSKDKIVLPLRSSFINEEAFLNTLWHELAHSTGHESRFNRDMTGIFGSPKYAREELIAELSAVFLEADFGLENVINMQEHSNYFKSWISVLKDNPKELFQATNEASRIAEHLTKNYEKIVEVRREITEKFKPEIVKALEENNVSDENIKKYENVLLKMQGEYLAEAKNLINNISKIEECNSDTKILIVWSESSDFKSNEILSFKEANERFEKREYEVRAIGENWYEKTKFIALIPTEEGKYKHILDRFDIGDGYQKNLQDFIKQQYKIDLEVEEKVEVNIWDKEAPFSKELVETLKRGTMYPDAIKPNEYYAEFLKESKKEYEEIKEIASPEDLERIDKEYESYKKNMYKYKLEYYKAQALIPSWTVTGRGNYNFKKLEKRNEREQRAFEEQKKVEEKWKNFCKKILKKEHQLQSQKEAKSLLDKIKIGEQNLVHFSRVKIGNIDAYKSESGESLIVKHYSAFTYLSNKWEKVLEKQENIWQLQLPKEYDNCRFETLKMAKAYASYIENSSSETTEEMLYSSTKEMYKTLVNEQDIENPKTDAYKQAKDKMDKAKNECFEKGISEERQEEIINKAKKDLKEEIAEEISDPGEIKREKENTAEI